MTISKSRQSPALKSQVRKIQRWLSKNEYNSGYSSLKLHTCKLEDEYGRLLGLSRRGVVIAYGGGCVVRPWTEYNVSYLKKLLASSKKVVIQKAQDTPK